MTVTRGRTTGAKSARDTHRRARACRRKSAHVRMAMSELDERIAQIRDALHRQPLTRQRAAPRLDAPDAQGERTPAALRETRRPRDRGRPSPGAPGRPSRAYSGTSRASRAGTPCATCTASAIPAADGNASSARPRAPTSSRNACVIERLEAVEGDDRRHGAPAARLQPRDGQPSRIAVEHHDVACRRRADASSRASTNG